MMEIRMTPELLRETCRFLYVLATRNLSLLLPAKDEDVGLWLVGRGFRSDLNLEAVVVFLEQSGMAKKTDSGRLFSVQVSEIKVETSEIMAVILFFYLLEERQVPIRPILHRSILEQIRPAFAETPPGLLLGLRSKPRDWEQGTLEEAVYLLLEADIAYLSADLTELRFNPLYWWHTSFSHLSGQAAAALLEINRDGGRQLNLLDEDEILMASLLALSDVCWWKGTNLEIAPELRRTLFEGPIDGSLNPVQRMLVVYFNALIGEKKDLYPWSRIYYPILAKFGLVHKEADVWQIGGIL